MTHNRKSHKGKSSQSHANSANGSNGQAIKVNTAKQAKVKESLLKLKELETQVFHLQEALFPDGGVDQATLINAAKYLRPDQYREVIEERVASNQCGYPICHNTLPKRTGKYRIDHSKLKVHDITELKLFCSSACYAASQYLSSQLVDDPLYMRDVSKVHIDLAPIGATTESIQTHILQTQSKQIPSELMRSTYIQSLLEKLQLSSVPASAELYIVEKELNLPQSQPVFRPNSNPDDIEGFRVRFSWNRKSKTHVAEDGQPSTEVLPEYQEKWQQRKTRHTEDCDLAQPQDYASPPSLLRKKSVSWASELEKIKTIVPVPRPKKVKKNKTNTNIFNSPTVVETKPENDNTKPETGITQQLAERSLDHKDTEGSDSAVADIEPDLAEFGDSKELDDDDDDDDDDIPHFDPSQNMLSPFGKLWTLIESLVTQETKTWLETSVEPDPVTVAKALTESGVDLQAFAARQTLFTQKMLKMFQNVRRDFQISFDIADHAISFLGTLYIRKNAVVLTPSEEKILVVIFLKALARFNTSLAEEIEPKWGELTKGMVLGLVEIETLSKSFQ